MRKISIFLVCVGFIGVLNGPALVAEPPAKPKAEEPEPASVLEYRRWTKVNPKPHRVENYLASLCAVPSPKMMAKMKAEEASNPHKDKFVTVYVNKIAKQAMLYQKKPVFPQGSMIVKQKLTAPDSKSPELLTVMRKREKGYDSASGDWEYWVLSGNGMKIIAQGRLTNCQSCHEKWKETDYVSRAYFTDEMEHKFQ